MSYSSDWQVLDFGKRLYLLSLETSHQMSEYLLGVEADFFSKENKLYPSFRSLLTLLCGILLIPWVNFIYTLP